MCGMCKIIANKHDVMKNEYRDCEMESMKYENVYALQINSKNERKKGTKREIIAYIQDEQNVCSICINTRTEGVTSECVGCPSH